MTYFSGLKQNQEKNRKGVIALNLAVVLGFFILLFGFLFLNDGLVGKNYELRVVQSSLSKQQALAKKLEIKLTEINSINNLQAVAKNLNLVAIDKVKYLESSQTSVALSGILNP